MKNRILPFLFGLTAWVLTTQAVFAQTVSVECYVNDTIKAPDCKICPNPADREIFTGLIVQTITAGPADTTRKKIYYPYTIKARNGEVLIYDQRSNTATFNFSQTAQFSNNPEFQVYLNGCHFPDTDSQSLYWISPDTIAITGGNKIQIPGITGGGYYWVLDGIDDALGGSNINTVETAAFDGVNGITAYLPVGGSKTITISGALLQWYAAAQSGGPTLIGDGGAAETLTIQGATGLTTALSTNTLTITPANDLAGLEALTGTGIVVRNASESYLVRTITEGTGISVTNGSGVSGNPTISNTGDLSSTNEVQDINFGGTGPFTLTPTLGGAGVSLAEGVNIDLSLLGNVLTISATGIVDYDLSTSGTFVTTLIGSGSSIQSLEGANIDITLGGTGANATLTYAAIPSGATTQIQYNDAGAFGAEADFTYNTAFNLLNVDQFRLDGIYYDKDGDPGAAGQILSSTSLGTDWINAVVDTDTDDQGLIYTGAAGGPVTLDIEDGTDVTITPGTNIAFNRVGADLEISSTATEGGEDIDETLDIGNITNDIQIFEHGYSGGAAYNTGLMHVQNPLMPLGTDAGYLLRQIRTSEYGVNPDVGYWSEQLAEYQSGQEGSPTARKNAVWSFGYNIDQAIADEGYIRFGIESNYRPGGGSEWFEWHAPEVKTRDGSIHRWYSITGDKDVPQATHLWRGNSYRFGDITDPGGDPILYLNNTDFHGYAQSFTFSDYDGDGSYFMIQHNDPAGDIYLIADGVGTTGVTRFNNDNLAISIAGDYGSAGDVLTSTGFTATWQPASVTTPANPDRSVQFNNAGAFGGSANFTYNAAGELFVIRPEGGAESSQALRVQNNNAYTGTLLYDNMGIYSRADVTTVGTTTGIFTYTLNRDAGAAIGVAAFNDANDGNGTKIGIMGRTSGSGGNNRYGGYFDVAAGYDWGVPSLPVQSALAANNNGVAHNIFTAFDNSTTVFNIEDGGNVGIFVTDPTEALHVSGNVRVTGAYLDSNNEPGTSGQILSSTAIGTDWINNTDAQTLTHNISTNELSISGGNTISTLEWSFYNSSSQVSPSPADNVLRTGATTFGWNLSSIATSIETEAQLRVYGFSNIDFLTFGSSKGSISHQRIYHINELSNNIASAQNRWVVKANGIQTTNGTLFNSEFGVPYIINSGGAATTHEIEIDFKNGIHAIVPNGVTYPNGYLYISYYHVYYDYDSIKVEAIYQDATVLDITSTLKNIATSEAAGYRLHRFTISDKNYLVKLRITWYSGAGDYTWPTEISYVSTRWDIGNGMEEPFVNKAYDQRITNQLTFQGKVGDRESESGTLGQLLMSRVDSVDWISIQNVPGFYTSVVNIADSMIGTPAVPGAPDKAIQFNDAGAFGGDSYFLFDKTTNSVSINQNTVGNGLVNITTANEDYTNTAGAGTIFNVNNTSGAGQIVSTYYINGVLQGKTRFDYGGNLTWASGANSASTGHFFFVNGDYPSGEVIGKFTNAGAIFSNGSPDIVGTSATQAVDVRGNIYVTGAYYDSSNDPGTSGQILSSTATGTDWISLGSYVDGSGTVNYVPKWTPDGNTLGNSVIRSGTNQIGIIGNVDSNPDIQVTIDESGVANYLRIGNATAVANKIYFGDAYYVNIGEHESADDRLGLEGGSLRISIGGSTGSSNQVLTANGSGQATWQSITFPDNSATNEIQTLTFAGSSNPNLTWDISGTASDVTLVAGGGLSYTSISATSATLTAVDQSASNEIQSLSLSGTGPFNLGITSGTGITITEGQNIDMSIGGTNITINAIPDAGNTYIQYNDAGLFGAEADFSYNPATNIMNVDHIRLDGIFYDKDNQAGSSGQVLSSTVTGTDWINVPGGSGTIDYVPKWITATTLGDSKIIDKGTNGAILIGTTSDSDETGFSGIPSSLKLAHYNMKYFFQTFTSGSPGYGWIGMESNAGGGAFIGLASGGVHGQVGTYTTGSDLTIYANNAAAFFESSNGNVGIYTTSPSQRLHVADPDGAGAATGHIRVEGAYYDSQNDPGSGFEVLGTSTSGSKTDWVMGSWTQTTHGETASSLDALTTIYLGQKDFQTTLGHKEKIYAPHDGTIYKVGCTCAFDVTTSEIGTMTVYLRKNNTTDYTVGSVLPNSSPKRVNSGVLGITMLTTDYLTVKVTQPDWQDPPPEGLTIHCTIFYFSTAD